MRHLICVQARFRVMENEWGSILNELENLGEPSGVDEQMEMKGALGRSQELFFKGNTDDMVEYVAVNLSRCKNSKEITKLLRQH